METKSIEPYFSEPQKMNFTTEQGEKKLHKVILELRALVVVDR